MLPLSIVKGSGLAEAPFFLSDYKYKTEAGSNLGGSTSCNKKGPIANLLNWRSRDFMCSDLINRGTIVLLKLLFNYFVFLHAWLLGTYIVSGFFFLYDFYVCHRSVSTLVQKKRTNRWWLWSYQSSAPTAHKQKEQPIRAWFMVSSAAGDSATLAASCGGGSHSYLMCCLIRGSNWMEKIWLASDLAGSSGRLGSRLLLSPPFSLFPIGCRRLKLLHNTCS